MERELEEVKRERDALRRRLVSHSTCYFYTIMTAISNVLIVIEHRLIAYPKTKKEPSLCSHQCYYHHLKLQTSLTIP